MKFYNLIEKSITILKDRRILGAWGGMIGSILFVGIFTLEGFLRPEYNPFSMFVSELSIGPRGWVQILNFIITGILLLIFALGIKTEFRQGKASKAGPILLLICATCLIVSGPFVMDPLSTPPDQMSWHGIIHNILGAIFFSLSAVSCFVFFRRFRDDPKWQSLKWWTLMAGTTILIAIILLAIGQKLQFEVMNIFSGWLGLIQRIALITFMIWLFIFALKLKKISLSDKN